MTGPSTAVPFESAQPVVLSRRRAIVYGALAAGGVVAGGSLLAACSSEGSTAVVNGTPIQGGTLHFAMYAVSSNIMPVDGTTELARWLTDPIVESLYKYDDQLNSVPSLAASMPEVVDNPDGTQSWTIALKPAVTFQNGDPFTAEHVEASIAHATNFTTPSSWVVLMSGIFDSVTVIDPLTIKLVTKTKQGILLSHLTNMPISHKDWLLKRDAVMGTGPFSLSPSDTQAGSTYLLHKYEGYHGTKPALDSIQVDIIPDPSSRVVELKQGRTNITTNVAASEAELLAKDPAISVTEVYAPVDILSYMKINRGNFTSLDFRKAVAFSMDRKAVRDVVYGGKAEIGQGPAGPGVIGYDPNLKVYPVETDYDTARQYLASSGVTNPSFNLSIANHPEVKKIAQILQASWKKIGINVTIEPLEGGPWIGKWLGGQYDMHMGVWQSGFATGNSNIIVFSPAMKGNVLNPGYDNQIVNDAMKVVYETDSVAERDTQLRIAAAQLIQDTWIVPPVYPKLIMAQRKDITDVNQNLLKVSRISLPPLQMRG